MLGSLLDSARLYLHHESGPDGQYWCSGFSSLDREWWNTAKIAIHVPGKFREAPP